MLLLGRLTLVEGGEFFSVSLWKRRREEVDAQAVRGCCRAGRQTGRRKCLEITA